MIVSIRVAAISSIDLVVVLGQRTLDRAYGLVAHAFDQRDAAVKQLLAMAISTGNCLGKYVGICGQGLRTMPTLPTG